MPAIMAEKYKALVNWRPNLIGQFVMSMLLSLLPLSIVVIVFLNVLNKYKIPDWAGLIFIYILFLIFLIITAFSIIPIFVKQSLILFDLFNNELDFIQKSYSEN